MVMSWIDEQIERIRKLHADEESKIIAGQARDAYDLQRARLLFERICCIGGLRTKDGEIISVGQIGPTVLVNTGGRAVANITFSHQRVAMGDAPGPYTPVVHTTYFVDEWHDFHGNVHYNGSHAGFDENEFGEFILSLLGKL